LTQGGGTDARQTFDHFARQARDAFEAELGWDCAMLLLSLTLDRRDLPF
jgi:hypothetical protein